MVDLISALKFGGYIIYFLYIDIGKISESTHWKILKRDTFLHFCELAKTLGCFFVGDSVLIIGQFLKTTSDKGNMVRFHFSGS